MEQQELYPELVDYIYYYQRKFMTKDERIASRTVLYRQPPGNEEMLAWLKARERYSDDNKIKQMIAGGYDALKIKIATRIYAEHKHELELNLCPKCGKLPRTPLAKQCRHCFYSWH